MSDTPIECVLVKAVLLHPQADRLEVVKVMGTQFCAPNGDFKAGDKCVYFPPEMLLPESFATSLGVVNYLKHAIYGDQVTKSKCRIGAIRLRSEPSFGFGLKLCQCAAFLNGPVSVGDDLTDCFHGLKYQPPEHFASGDQLPHLEVFPIYTSIQHYYRNAAALPEGTPVRITCKIHGTNSRIGRVKVGGEYIFVAGSHHARKAQYDTAGNLSLYWVPFNVQMEYALQSFGDHAVSIFGEIFGHKIQKMDYGYARGQGYRVFDISVDGRYLNWEQVKAVCEVYGLATVPLLYRGPFHSELVTKYMSGPTLVNPAAVIKSKFKGREGIIITPLTEQHSDLMDGRLILKAVSPDYYAAIG